MQKQLLKLLVNMVSLYIIAAVFHPVKVSGIVSIVIFGIVLWGINLLLRPILLLITLPINILTLGVFSLMVSTLMIMLADAIVKGVDIPGFLLSFALAVVIMVLYNISKRLFQTTS